MSPHSTAKETPPDTEPLEVTPPAAEPEPSGRSRRVLIGSLPVGAVAAALIILCAVLAWRGYRAYVMQTPSMGTAAPVGSLVVTEPVEVDELRAGDVVTVAPRAGGSTHTHRVVEVSGGSATTRGDLNGTPDPETVDSTNLVGRAVVIAPVLGWAVEMLPVVVAVFLVTVALTHRVRDRAGRFRYRALGLFCGLALAIVLVKPLLGAQLLSMRVDEDQDGPRAVAGVVSTGIFPVRISPAEDQGRASELLAPTGTAGEAVATKASEQGKFVFYPHLVLTPAWWVGIVLFCASPFPVFGLHALVTARKAEPAP